MAIKSSGTLSLRFDIAPEFGSSNYSLRYLSSLAGFSTPDAMSEFYGFSVAPPPPPPPPPPPSCFYVTWNGFGVISYSSPGGGSLGARGNYFDDCTDQQVQSSYINGNAYLPGQWDGQKYYGVLNYYWYLYAINSNVPGGTFSFYISGGSYSLSPLSFSVSGGNWYSQDFSAAQLFASGNTTTSYFMYGIGPCSYR